MRQKLFIFFGLFLVTIILVAINALSYQQKDKMPDSEFEPNRSTFNSGSTGTRAFYDLLGETGRKIVRWQQKPSALLKKSPDTPATFVIIGATRLSIEGPETELILRWVAGGGKLVIIDREPNAAFLSTTANWSISNVLANDMAVDVDSSNPAQMTLKTEAGKPTQPTVFTKDVNAVQPSRFASSVKLEYLAPGAGGNHPPITSVTTPTPGALFGDDEEGEPPPEKSLPTPISPKSTEGNEIVPDERAITSAPFIHIASKDKIILADFQYGAGQIVFLTDPYIVSNSGISLVDNAQLAVNVVSSQAGLIAFDEYHHGYGVGNPLIDYFADTPFLAIGLQLALILGVICFTQSRRFARPVPLNETDRLSKLEYVSAMAQLQASTRAYDLVVENFYTEFRRSVSKHFGVDNYITSRASLAALISERTNIRATDLEDLFSKCEAIIHGGRTSKREVLDLTRRLREIEDKLNLKRKWKEAFRK